MKTKKTASQVKLMEWSKIIMEIQVVHVMTIHLDFEIIEESMKFRYKNKKSKFSYADCLGYIAARKNNLVFLTGDSGFKNFPNVEFVEREK